MSFSGNLDNDLGMGIELEDCVRRFAGYVDSWIAGQGQWREQIELRLSRLEAVSKIDKQTINEVDNSVRQSWEDLDNRLKKLEEAYEQRT